MQDLPVENGLLDNVLVDNRDSADPGDGKIDRDGRAEPSGTGNEDVRLLQPLLPLFTEEQRLPFISIEFVCG